MAVFLICFFILFFLNFSSIDSYDTEIYLNKINHNNQLRQFYFPFFNQTLDLIDLVLNDQERNTDEICDHSLLRFKNGLINFEEWALKIYEANGKPKNGKLFGYNGDLGDYDQCLSIEYSLDQKAQFTGQYCLVSIQTEETESIKQEKLYKKNNHGLSESSKFITDFSLGTVQGVCLPSTCNINDLLNSINKVSKSIQVISQKHCSIANQSEKFILAEIFAFGLFGLITFLCVISTVISNRFLDHFHIGKNFMKIYNVNDSSESSSTTNHLHGTKVGYLFIGIMGHCWGMLLPFAPFLYSGFKSIKFASVMRSFLDRILVGPDMMFFISGFLSMYTWYNPMRKYKISISKYLLIRYCRCLTVVGIAILGGYIWPRFGSGPYFTELAQHFHKSCSKSVWKNILFINNQDRMLDICALPTWFLSSDFQLYIQNYFTVYYFSVAPKIGFLISAFQIILNSAYTIYDAYINNYPKYMTCTNMTALNSIEVEQQYFFTYLHSNVYIFGIICGWLVVSKKEIKLSNLSVCLIWICTLTLTFSSFFLPDLWHYGFINVNQEFLYVWPVLGRLLFISAIFWSVYSTSFNYNRTLKSILSSRFMIVISRMSMSIVTCQFFYLWYFLGTRRDIIRLTVFDLLREGILAFFVCLFIGFLMHLFIEAPVVNLLYTIFGLRRRIELTEKVKEELKKVQLQKQIQIQAKEQILRGDLVQEEKANEKDLMLDENANEKELMLDENANEKDCKNNYNDPDLIKSTTANRF